MDRIGNKSGSVGWGQKSVRGKGADASGSASDLQFKRALGSGSQSVHKAPARYGTRHSAGQFQPQAIASSQPAAVYETTKVMTCNEFVCAHPETKPAIQPIIDLNKYKQLPMIALVSCSGQDHEATVERIGNTIFISRNGEMAEQPTRLDETIVMNLVGAIAQCLGSN